MYIQSSALKWHQLGRIWGEWEGRREKYDEVLSGYQPGQMVEQ
jgi:hypothetical protein